MSRLFAPRWQAAPRQIWSWLQNGARLESFLLGCLLAAYAGWVLSLPLFPTQDGPMHLYLIHILHALLFDKGGMWAQFFTVKHYVPPYALYYYLLMSMEGVFPPLLAEKLLVCLFFVTFAYGFRYLARSIGGAADSMTLLATGLCLSYPLGMGFMNYCLSVALGLWTAGSWLRLLRRPELVRSIMLVSLAVLVTLTHPVGLLLLLSFIWISFAAHLARGPHKPGWLVNRLRSERHLLLTALAAATPLLYLRRFTVASPHAGTGIHAVFRIPDWLHPHRIATPLYFPMHGLDGHLYGLCWILALFVACRSLYEGQRFSRPSWREPAPSGWLLVAVLAAGTLPFIPSQLGDGLFFAERLTVVVWILVLLAGSVGAQPARSLRLVTAVIALATSVTAFHLGERLIRPIANEIASIPHIDVRKTGRVGMMLEDSSKGVRIFEPLPFDPYLWAPAHLFRVNDAILYNAPWMEESTIPIGTSAAYTLPPMPGHTAWQPLAVDYWMRQNPRQAIAMIERSDFLLVDQIDSSRREMSAPYQFLEQENRGMPAPDCGPRLDKRLLFCNVRPLHRFAAAQPPVQQKAVKPTAHS